MFCRIEGSMFQKIENFKEEYEKSVLELAGELRGQAMPVLTEELFSEYERNGSRLGYEGAYFGRRKFLSVLGLACVIGREPENIRRLEEVLSEVCKEECWALPAHVDRAGNPNWRITIDLFASETAQALAQLITLLKNELPKVVVETVKKEVYKRVLTPFMESAAPYAGWEESRSNWNAVCCGNIGSAGLFLLEDNKERRALMERLAYALRHYYLQGFGNDGACEEGLGYWAYGFTYYTLFARQLKEAYPDMDLMAEKKTEAIACFQQKCYFGRGRTISFSDASCFERYAMGLTCSLAHAYGSVRFPAEESARRLGQDSCWRWVGVYWDWYWTKEYLKAVREGRAEPPKELEDFGDAVFPDVQWAVFRGAKGSAAAIKGGHNAESHNHNDVGSFLYLAGDEVFLEDLGCGEYTRDYFSDKRYTVFCNRGRSHNIPIINGNDQRPGKEYCAEEFTVGKGSVLIRFSSAYGIKELKSLERRIRFEAAGGELTVTDTARADGDIDFWENLVTRLPADVDGNRIVIYGGSLNVRITAKGAAGGIKREAVRHINHRGEAEQVNVLKWKVRPQEEGLYESSFTASILSIV